MSLTLYVAGGGTINLQASDTDLKSTDTFAEVVVHSGTWIFYKCKDFNPKAADSTESSIKLLQPNPNQVHLSDCNGSVYLVPEQTQGIVLFSHFWYCGEREYFNGSCDNVNQYFPHSQDGGVSSAIVLGGEFDVCSKTNGGGVKQRLTEGCYPTSAKMNFGNDKVQSIVKLN